MMAAVSQASSSVTSISMFSQYAPSSSTRIAARLPASPSRQPMNTRKPWSRASDRQSA